MNETTKARPRREREGFFERYCQGAGIDIGHGGDMVLPEVRGWDKEDGDAQKLEGVADASYDFVYSSHCLEHLSDPLEAMLNWWRVLKVGGYLIVVVPNEDLYEQRIWPSVFNIDHRHTFAIHKEKTWSPVGVNLMDLVTHLPMHDVVYVRVVDTEYDYQRKDIIDQTQWDVEAGIELVVKKIAPDFTFHSQMAQVFRCPRCGYGRLAIEGLRKDNSFALMCNRCGERTNAQLSVNS